MSIMITLCCEGCLAEPGYDDKAEIYGSTVAEVRAKAREIGWKMTRDGDYCDWCVQKQQRRRGDTRRADR